MIRYIGLLCLGLSLAIFVGCGDDDPEDTHAEAEGLVLMMNGAEILRYENGVVSDTLTVRNGQETDLISVKFIDADGDLFVPDNPDMSINLTIANTAIAETEQHNDENWAFHLHGHSVGATTLEILLMHDDHPDFRSKLITVQVTP